MTTGSDIAAPPCPAAQAALQAEEEARRAVQHARALLQLQKEAMQEILSPPLAASLPPQSPPPSAPLAPHKPCASKAAALLQLRISLEQGAHFVIKKPAAIVQQPVMGQGRVQPAVLTLNR